MQKLASFQLSAIRAGRWSLAAFVVITSKNHFLAVDDCVEIKGLDLGSRSPGTDNKGVGFGSSAPVLTYKRMRRDDLDLFRVFGRSDFGHVNEEERNKTFHGREFRLEDRPREMVQKINEERAKSRRTNVEFISRAQIEFIQSRLDQS